MNGDEDEDLRADDLARGGVEPTCGDCIEEDLDGTIEVDANDDATNESVRPRVLRSPSTPSRQEVLEHNITHCPFRSWCKDCVCGKSKASHHISTATVDEEDEVPLIAFDYAFMSQSDGGAIPVEGTIEDEFVAGGDAVVILVGRET